MTEKRIKTTADAAAIWPGLKAVYEAAYDPEKRAELEAFLAANRKPLTRWQKFKAPFQEAKWRFGVAFDVLRRGDRSGHLREY